MSVVQSKQEEKVSEFPNLQLCSTILKFASNCMKVDFLKLAIFVLQRNVTILSMKTVEI